MARLAELAVERWLDGLGTPESIEFETLRARHPTFAIDSLEAVAATLRVNLGGSPDLLPDRVRSKLAKEADRYFGARAMPPDGVAVHDLEPGWTRARARSWFAYGGWLTAAASLLLSASLWVMRPASVDAPGAAMPLAASKKPEAPSAPALAAPLAGANTVPAESTPVPRAELADSATDERAQFLTTHTWLLQRSLLPGPDPTGEAVKGDVVWDAQSQTGYLKLRGLRRNDPNVEQYQLWIFDARRDERFPVDGGVFNVSHASGDEVIRFTARLSVEVPLMFVVTVEHRGGVVVSDRSRIAAIAHSS